VLGNGKTTNNLKQAFVNESGEELRLKVLNFVRDELKQSDMVATEIMSKNFDVTKLSLQFVNSLIGEIQKNNTSNISDLVIKNKTLRNWLDTNGVTVKDFVEKLTKIQSTLTKAKDPKQIEQLANELAKKQKITDNNQIKVSPEKLEDQLNKNIITFSVKKALFDEFVHANVDNRGKIKDSSKFSSDMENELNLYSDIE